MSVSSAIGVTASRSVQSVSGLQTALDIAATLGNQVVANRTHYPFNGFSSGSNTASNYRSVHYTKAGGRVSLLKLVFNNSTIGTTGEAVGNAAFTVKASIEYNSVTYPVYFGGTTRTKSLALDEQVVSDAVAVSIPANTLFYVRTYVTVTNLGEKWPVAQAAVTAIGEGFAATTDKTDDYTYTSFSAASIFCPSAILGYTSTDTANVLIIGSSSGWGQGDTAESPTYDFGYISRALRASGHDYIKFTRASTAMSHYLTGAGYLRLLAYLNVVKPTHVIHQLGPNDLTSAASFATMQSRINSMVDILGSTGARVIQATYTPVTTSTDSWATLVNQTVVSSNTARIDTNNWIRGGGVTGITGYIECCGAVESSQDSGKFKVTGVAGAYTADGTHLTQLGHQETAATLGMAAALAR